MHSLFSFKSMDRQKKTNSNFSFQLLDTTLSKIALFLFCLIRITNEMPTHSFSMHKECFFKSFFGENEIFKFSFTSYFCYILQYLLICFGKWLIICHCFQIIAICLYFSASSLFISFFGSFYVHWCADNPAIFWVLVLFLHVR